LLALKNTFVRKEKNVSRTSIQPPEQDPPEHTKLLTVHEVANRLRVDDTTVRRWSNTGIIAHVTLPHKGKRRAYRYSEQAINDALQSGGF
jgi:excisionase family DNA binding protein